MEWVYDFELWSFVYAAGVVPIWFSAKWLYSSSIKDKTEKAKEDLERVKRDFKKDSEIVDLRKSIVDLYTIIKRLEDERKEMRSDIKSLAQEINVSTTKLEGHMNDLMMTMVKLNIGRKS